MTSKRGLLIEEEEEEKGEEEEKKQEKNIRYSKMSTYRRNH